MVLYILKMLNIDLMFLSLTYTCIYIEKLTKDFGGDRYVQYFDCADDITECMLMSKFIRIFIYIYIKCVHFFNIPFTSKKQKKKKKINFEASGNGTKGLQKMYQHIFRRTYYNTVITVRIYSI